jgi:hypothetical protein
MSADTMLAVLLESGNGNGLIAYGPFDEDDRAVADRFAAYLTAEVDPAKVVPAADVLASKRPVRWYSVIRELLAWYEHNAGGAR